MSYFPIKIEIAETGNLQLIETPEQLPVGIAFKVVETNAPSLINGTSWIGVDLDGTLVIYEGTITTIGKVIAPMKQRVMEWLAAGKTVKIFTARASLPDQVQMVSDWSLQEFGQRLEVTDRKDFTMIEYWDDRAVQVVPNTGLTVQEYLTSRQSG